MLNEVLILLFFSVVSLAIFKRLNFPSVLGYLVVGMLAGEHAFGWIHASHAIEQIAEIGVVFLLFTIGLEVSIPKLIAMRGIVFGIGTVQVVVSTCIYPTYIWHLCMCQLFLSCLPIVDNIGIFYPVILCFICIYLSQIL